MVLLVWSDGQIRIPISFRVWKKGGPSKFDLALELLSVLKSQLTLEGCQAGYRRSTEKKTHLQPQTRTHHIALYLVACLIVERERFNQGMTWRQFKRHLILKRSQPPLPALEQVRMAA
jgi:hypothetical protein